ncbi:MAG: Spy/CpxP family protein refolding chaperone [Saprospiraceae bacterium]
MTDPVRIVRRYRLAVLLLALLNVFLLGSVFFSPHGPPPAPRQRILNRWASELALSAEQKQQFGILFDAHRAEADSLRALLKNNRHLLVEALAQTPADTTNALALARQAAQWDQQINEGLIRHLLDLQAVCTPEQQQKMGEAFLKTLPKRD